MTEAETLLKLVYDTGAVSIWDNRTGPVFWYAAGVPGPFYCNTEKMIGAENAAKLLERMNAALAEGGSAEERYAKIRSIVMAEYSGNDNFKTLVSFLAQHAAEEFGGKPEFISGGERRDWIFSIPVAEEIGLPHIAMFKDGSIATDKGGLSFVGGNILHVSDLVNNAASFFDLWIPILAKQDARPAGSLSLVNRGRIGMDKIEDAGIKPVSLLSIDSALFRASLDGGLIRPDQFDEIELYYKSPREWAEKYIITNADIFQAEMLEKKSKARMQSFFAKDPWDLKSLDETFFRKTAEKLGA